MPAALLAALIAGWPCNVGHSERPNIVVVVLDTVRRDHLPVYGYPRETAPFLAGLARRSVVFDRAYSTSSWTAPAIASLFTSQWPQRHGVVLGATEVRRSAFRVSRVPQDVDVLPVVLRGAGYSTFGVSDNVNVSPVLGFERGFDQFSSSYNGSGTLVNKTIKRWREAMVARPPYCLFVQYMDAHEPYAPRGPWFEQFLADDRPERIGRHHVAAYDSEIRFLDERLEGLFREMGWDRDTVLIVTSDHGQEFSEHGYTGHGQSLYAEVLDIPLIVHGPGFVPRRVEEPVSLVDLLPTLRELSGAPPDPADVGWSLVPLLRGRDWDRPPRPIVAHLVAIGTAHVYESVIYRGLKLIRGPRERLALFDLARDGGDRDDIAASRPADVHRLARMLPARVARRLDVDEKLLSPEVVEQLRALGYIR